MGNSLKCFDSIVDQSIFLYVKKAILDEEKKKAIQFILVENQIQTTSTSPCRTQVQPVASFLVCSLIFIDNMNEKLKVAIL